MHRKAARKLISCLFLFQLQSPAPLSASDHPETLFEDPVSRALVVVVSLVQPPHFHFHAPAKCGRSRTGLPVNLGHAVSFPIFDRISDGWFVHDCQSLAISAPRLKRPRRQVKFRCADHPRATGGSPMCSLSVAGRWRDLVSYTPQPAQRLLITCLDRLLSRSVHNPLS